VSYENMTFAENAFNHLDDNLKLVSIKMPGILLFGKIR